jgi:hypothetical protein
MLTKSTMLNMSGKELLVIGKQAVHQEDLETVSDVYAHLKTLADTNFARTLRFDSLRHLNMEPIPFLEKARTISESYSKNSTGTYTVYVVLLVHKYKKEIGLYVGQSSRSAEDRFKQHMAGGRLSARCHRHMRCLLPSIYSHLTDVSRDESLCFEDALIKRFKQAGIWTEGA